MKLQTYSCACFPSNSVHASLAYTFKLFFQLNYANEEKISSSWVQNFHTRKSFSCSSLGYNLKSNLIQPELKHAQNCRRFILNQFASLRLDAHEKFYWARAFTSHGCLWSKVIRNALNSHVSAQFVACASLNYMHVSSSSVQIIFMVVRDNVQDKVSSCNLLELTGCLAFKRLKARFHYALASALMARKQRSAEMRKSLSIKFNSRPVFTRSKTYQE